jgi:hypothetical protein
VIIAMPDPAPRSRSRRVGAESTRRSRRGENTSEVLTTVRVTLSDAACRAARAARKSDRPRSSAEKTPKVMAMGRCS